MFFKVLRAFVLLTFGIVFASCFGLDIQVAFDLDGPKIEAAPEKMTLGKAPYSIRFDEAIRVATVQGSTTQNSITISDKPAISVTSAVVNPSTPTQLNITFTNTSSLNGGDTITIIIPEGYLTDEADNPNDLITHKVTVVQDSDTKPELKTATLTYTDVTTTAGTATTGAVPSWSTPGTNPTLTNITYSITGYAPPVGGGSGSNGSTATPPVVEIDSGTGQITITADATVVNSGDYTVTATAGATSNYANTTTQTTTVTVKVKGNLSNYSLSYPIAKRSEDGRISVSPVWRQGTASIEAPSTVEYAISGTALPNGLTLDANDGTISVDINSLSDENNSPMPKVTAYQITATGNGTDYEGSISGTFLDTFLLENYTPTTTGTAISTVQDLKTIAPDREYYLTDHIDLNNTAWTPIASKDSPFTGKLHGNGYAIYNLTINNESTTHQGLFASVSGATIENLGIGVTSIKGKAGVGALAGVAKKSVILSNIAVAPMDAAAKIVATGTTLALEDSRFTGALLGGLVGLLRSGSLEKGYNLVPVEGSGDRVGGLVGEGNNATVTGFTTGDVPGTGNHVGGLVGEGNNATVTGDAMGDVTGIDYVGGLVGKSNGGTVNGHATGFVSGTKYVGGLVGYNTGTITGYATGNVKGQPSTGGLVGESTGSVTGYAMGNVKGTWSTGGLVGKSTGTSTGYATGVVSGTTNVGGLVGENFGTVTGYATGTVTGTSLNPVVGGLVGSSNTDTVTGYWDKQSTGQNASSGGGVGISATRNIVFDATTGYTDNGSNTVIFNNTSFKPVFDTTNGASQTWPKLMNFPYPQPTVSGTAADGTINVTPPVEAEP